MSPLGMHLLGLAILTLFVLAGIILVATLAGVGWEWLEAFVASGLVLIILLLCAAAVVEGIALYDQRHDVRMYEDIDASH